MIFLDALAVSAILNEGMLVSVRLGSGAAWHGNIIYEVSNSTIRIAYIDKFMKVDAIPGRPAWIKFSNDYFVYYFSGIVKSINTVPPEYVCIKIDTAEEIINNRLFPRYDVKLRASLKPVWDDEVYHSTVTDLSYGGAAFICAHKFDSNEHLEMSLSLPGNITVKVTGKVIRRKCSQSTIADHAVQFIECDNVNSRLLSEYFSKLEDETSEIYQHYVAKIKGKL